MVKLETTSYLLSDANMNNGRHSFRSTRAAASWLVLLLDAAPLPSLPCPPPDWTCCPRSCCTLGAESTQQGHTSVMPRSKRKRITAAEPRTWTLDALCASLLEQPDHPLAFKCVAAWSGVTHVSEGGCHVATAASTPEPSYVRTGSENVLRVSGHTSEASLSLLTTAISSSMALSSPCTCCRK